MMIAPESRSDRLPTVLLIHDGTHGEPANGWSRRWNPVLFSAPGYVVIGIDFRVTGGHGTAERDALVLNDLRLGMSVAADRFSLDPAKVCIAGNGAYGGYLVYLIAGQAKGQSQCLIANGSVVDAMTQSYQTDEPWMHDWQPASAEVGTANPLHQAWAWRTPVLILHGEKDFRVPYAQAVAAFTAAQRYNVPSRLVVFPDEGTWVQAPKNTIQWYGEVLNWLDRWLTDARLPTAGRRFMESSPP
jgi:dipeptidyl aminopeptidase/acylaminoacyl peptidase